MCKSDACERSVDETDPGMAWTCELLDDRRRVQSFGFQCKDTIGGDNNGDIEFYGEKREKKQRGTIKRDKNEMKKLFEVIKGHELEIPFMLAAYYGFRRSEVLGLRWSAVDFDHKLISINHKMIVVGKEVILTDELKTKTSNRTLPLIPAIEEALLRHREQIEKNKAFYGNTYDQRYLQYVCVEENGNLC